MTLINAVACGIVLHPVSVDVTSASATLADFTLNLSANVTNIPEPASAALLLAAGPLLLRRRRRASRA